MKKIYFIIFCVCSFLLSSCSSNYNYGIDGYENFKSDQSNFELNLYILPSDDFIDNYEHKTVEYHYRDQGSLINLTERSIITVCYEEEDYNKAKEYCLQNMQLSNTICLEYNGYTFIENIELAIGQERYGTNSFPQWFNMFVYNDSQNILIFLGMYSAVYTSEDTQSILDDWGQFVRKHFSDLHDWDQADDSVISTK